jgi:hypothetical protein
VFAFSWFTSARLHASGQIKEGDGLRAYCLKHAGIRIDRISRQRAKAVEERPDYMAAEFLRFLASE